MDGLIQLRDAIFDRIRSVLARHGRTLWWLHSTYALALGISVVLFAQRGFANARWLAASIVGAWLIVVLLFRVFGSGATQHSFELDQPRARLRLLVMTYVLKNLYQGMLFFLLPFYWKSATWGAPNALFVVLLGACAVVSTLDVVFDEVIMRRRWLASLFHGFTLFASLNLLVPALLSDTRTLASLMTAAGVTILAFWTLHVPPRAFLRNRTFALLVLSIGAGVGLSVLARTLVPPVPMHLASGAVGPVVLPDGRLVMEVKTLHASAIRQLVAVTDIVVPGGTGDELRHVWRHEGHEIAPSAMSRPVKGPRRSIRLTSMLGAEKLPAQLAGAWTVDVETADGQLVGRVGFDVVE